MKQLAYLVLVSLLLFSYSTGQARNTLLKVSIEEALAWGEDEGVLKSSVRLYFGDQEHPAIERNLGTYTANRKTNAFGKSDQKACKWAFLSAMVTLQDRAIAEGGNAVVNIHSYYSRNEFSSATEFECGAGAIMAGVTMVGDVVQLAE
ncbi:MAG: excinuclease ATPase subunit [Gammaproteobacteria bacterium]|nr:excinuclease ATPase subunit [Gammaproteobacteria bacterium]MDH3428629.1 excinuclease ATPase subunit [Gammaproteobacteria bacterium]MDH3433533.1 excinuclease ATPase subunit [Gammaproteobacteria bacterium]